LTRLRKLELVTGLGTALLSILVSVIILKIEREDAQYLERDFAMLEQIKLAILFFMLSGLIVAIGSYIHAVKRKGWGRVILGAGSLFLTINFLRYLVVLVWSPGLWSLLFVLLTVFAIVTAAISVPGQGIRNRQEKHFLAKQPEEEPSSTP
jgi:hypothetical protein